MIECGGVFLPDGETHMVEWMTKRNQRIGGKLTYQYEKQQAAMRHCRAFRSAVDIGAHVGLWSMHLAPAFQLVYAFEPVPAHRDCFYRNVDFGNVTLLPFALGEADALVNIWSNPTSSGDSKVQGPGDTVMRRLDDFEFTDVDFIKADCEGYELFALKGGAEMIKRWRPTICVEQKPGMAPRYGLGETDAVDWLQGLGAQVCASISGDYILAFP